VKAIGKKMKLQDDGLIHPVLGILGDLAQVTGSVDLEVQYVTHTDQEVEVQEYVIVSFLDTDPDLVHHIELEIHFEVVQNAIDRLALKGYQGDQ
jgi:hypothetical protein